MGDWLTVIIVLLILGILLDGWRRMRNAQRDSLKVSRSMRRSLSLSGDNGNDDYRSAELPNGGARVVAYRDSSQDRPRHSAHQASIDDSDFEEADEPELGSDEVGYDDADYDESYRLDETDRLEEPEYDRPEPHSKEAREAPAPSALYEPEPRPTPELQAEPEPQSRQAHYREEFASAEIDGTDEPTMHTEPDAVSEDDVERMVEPPTRETPLRPTQRAQHRSATGKGRIPEQVALNLDDSVPILMETTDGDDAQEGTADGRIEPTFGGGAQSPPGSFDPVERNEHPSQAEPKPAPTPSFGSALGSSLGQKAKQAKAALSAKLAEKAAQFNHTDSAPEKTEEPAAPAHEPAPPKSKPAPRKVAPKPAPSAPPEPEEVLVINVMAPKGKQFLGDALLDALMRAGLRYGDMNIFHRYEEERGGGAILFSLANMVKPGTFDLNAMDEFHTPGVSLFMTLPLEDASLENIDVFELMLDSARSLVNDLGGELKDENRSVMTRQTMEHCRQRIHEFDRKQLSRAPH